MYTQQVPGVNHLGQPIGDPVPDWKPPPLPPHEAMPGGTCRLEPLDPARHAAQLFAAHERDGEYRNWTYLQQGPYDTLDDYARAIERAAAGDDPQFYAVVVGPRGSGGPDSHGVAAGVAAYLRMAPAAGSIEVGHIHFSPLLQRTPAATEAMFLMMRRAFDLGYRRYEWKCDALNASSRAAAQRLGLSFEGVFRQAAVYKGRNRDTAWYAAIDREWPALQAAFEEWLDPANFAGDGRQRVRLSSLTAPLLASRG